MKYQSSSTYCSKVISKVKVFQKWFKLQGQGHMVDNGTHRKVLSQGIIMWNIKALALTVQKFLARLKFQRGGQNDRQDNINIKSCLLSYSISSEHEVLLSTSSEPSELDMPYAQNWGVQICHVMKVSITTFNNNIFLKMALKGGGMKFSFPYIDKIWEWD